MELPFPFPIWWYIWRFWWVICLGQRTVSVISKVMWDAIGVIWLLGTLPALQIQDIFKESWSSLVLFHIALVHQVESDRLRTLPGGPSQWGIPGIRIIATLLSSGVVKRLLQQLWPWTSKLNPWEIATTAWALAKLQVVEDWRCFFCFGFKARIRKDVPLARRPLRKGKIPWATPALLGFDGKRWILFIFCHSISPFKNYVGTCPINGGAWNPIRYLAKESLFLGGQGNRSRSSNSTSKFETYTSERMKPCWEPDQNHRLP